MRIIACMSICLLLVLTEVISAEESRLQKRSICASNCRSNHRDDNCYNNCDSKCSNPCNRRCRNSENCQPDSADCEEVQEKVDPKPIILPPVKQGESINKNVNHLKNDNKVDINPNITMTNTITNTNNISVPIDVTSMNVNTIRVSSIDTRRIDTNITSSPVNCSGSGRQTQDCFQNQKRIIIVPYPYRAEPKPEVHEIIPPVQAHKVQTVSQQPVMLAPPMRPVVMSNQFLPPVQRQEMIMPIPIAAPMQRPEYFQSILEPAPFNQQQQIMWYPRQPMVTQQEFIPQHQNFFPIQQNILPMSVARPCSSYSNQPCSAQAPIYYTEPCSTPDCMNRYPYVMTSPYSPTNGLPYFSSNQYLPSFGMNENQLQYLNNRQLQTPKDSNKI